MAELARNLTHADQYRTIATALRRADRAPEAIAWARRGLAEKGSWPNAERLRDLLVDLLIDVGDGSAALAERRAEFDLRPTHAAYRDLIDTAVRVGAEHQQEWAMRMLTDRTVGDPRHARELVAVLLAEGLLEQAWQVGYSHHDQLPEPQWVHLLDQRRASHPADVIEPYRELVAAHILDSRDKHRHRRAITLLRQLRDAHVAAGGSDAFAAYLQDLRVRHKRRPTFLARLAAAAL